MVVKKTKSGKITVGLVLSEREQLFLAVANAMTSSVTEGIETEVQVLRRIYQCILVSLYARDWRLYICAEKRFLFTAPEALALMWVLRKHDHNMSMLELKSGLHKQLHG